MSIQIRLIAGTLTELITAGRRLEERLGERITMNRPRDAHSGACLAYGIWTPSLAPEPAAERGWPGHPLPEPPAHPQARVPIQIRLIAGTFEEISEAGHRLEECLGPDIDLHGARDSRNGEWIVYGTWMPSPVPSPANLGHPVAPLAAYAPLAAEPSRNGGQPRGFVPRLKSQIGLIRRPLNMALDS